MPENMIVTRFAPSPTGFLHAGAYRTAIYSYLFARKNNGKFVLRIEDTDKSRSKKEFEDNIIDSLAWLGLDHDVFVRQSENLSRHRDVLHKLIESGSAYLSKEEAKDGSGEIKEIVRFKNPNIDVSFKDEIKGSVTMNTSDLGDFVIAKNLNEPLFHLAVVIDDYDAGVTHVIRGEDHVSNTPRQILIQRAIGAPTPIYAHLPLVLGLDRQKLSKRRGALPLSEYRSRGYLPGAILNMVALVGWNPGTDQEIFTKSELIDQFDLTRVQRSPAAFNPEKLEWINKEHIKRMPHNVLVEEMTKYLTSAVRELPQYTEERLSLISEVIMERVTNFGQVRTMAEQGELDYWFDRPRYSVERLFWKGTADYQRRP
jgi:glutamyl/glutaminyl-tRNA synthetase